MTQQWLRPVTDDESASRRELEPFTAGCKSHSLILNVDKTKEMVIDFWRARTHHAPVNIHGADVKRVSSVRFLGVHLARGADAPLKAFSRTVSLPGSGPAGPTSI